MDAYGDTIYGFHKKLAEQIVKKNADSYLILRCCAMIGKGMKKGVVKDLIDEKPLWITGDTKMQFITVSEVAKIVKTMIDKEIINGTHNVGGFRTILIKEIAEMLGIEYIIRTDATYQENGYSFVQFTDELFPLKTSKQYIQEFIDERMEQSL